MKLDDKQLEKITKTADEAEKMLKKGALTKDEIEKLDRDLEIILADIGMYKRFFKRLT